MSTRPLLCSAALASALAGLAGCDDAARPGTVEVRWRTGQLTCEAAGVSTVRTALYAYGAVEPIRGIERLCPEGGTLLEDIAPGDYTVLLSGDDVDGCWTHQARDDISVGDGEAVTVSLPLLRRDRPLYVRWPFANELDCLGNGVEQVQITIDVEDRFTWTEAFVCPGLVIQIPIEVPPGDVAVRVVGLDRQQRPVATGRVEADGRVFTDTPCADHVEIRVPLELCASPGCEDELP